jgi:hypothetical protein
LAPAAASTTPTTATTAPSTTSTPITTGTRRLRAGVASGPPPMIRRLRRRPVSARERICFTICPRTGQATRGPVQGDDDEGYDSCHSR